MTFPDLLQQELQSRHNTGPKPGESQIIPIKKGVWRTYDANDGLPGETHCLLQDRQGYLRMVCPAITLWFCCHKWQDNGNKQKRYSSPV